jgi:D-amino-acid dehydrogenase
MKIAIVGAGITGSTVAYYLGRRGHVVDLYEQESAAALRCSYANGGQISVSNSEVWNTWSNIFRGLGWLGNPQAPLLIRPQWDRDQFTWLYKFIANTVLRVYQKNTAKTIAMGLESRVLYDEIMADEQIEFDHDKSGILHIYRDHQYWKRAQQAQDIYQNNHCQWQLLNPREILDLEPALADCQNIVGGAYTADDSVGDIHLFCQQLIEVCQQKYNCTFIKKYHVQDLRDLAAAYDAVVVSAGIDSQTLARQVGDNLSIYPVKGYSITINDINNTHAQHCPKVSLLDDQTKIVSSTLGTRFRVAGTAELIGINYEVNSERIEPLLNWVHQNFPNLDTHNYSSWACLRPMTPDMMPIVRASTQHKRVFYHTGHGHLGWTLSPRTAIMCADLIERSL